MSDELLQLDATAKENLAVEKFHSFREVHSLEWHAHRYQVGQSFLDQFVRQVSFLSLINYSTNRI